MNTLAYWAVCLMVFVITWENVIVIEQVGTITQVLGPAVALVVLMTLLRDGTFRPYVIFHGVLIAYFSWGALSYLWSVDPHLTLTAIPRMIQLLILVMILWQVGESRETVYGLYTAYVAGVGVSALLTIYEFLRSGSEGSQRWAASGFNPNNIALIMSLGIPTAWYLFQRTSSTLARLFYATVVVTGAAAVILTGSRTGAVLLALAFVYLIVGARHLAGKAAGFVIGMILLALIVEYTPRSILNRYGTIAPEIAEGSPQNRAAVWQLGVTEWLEAPFQGVGFGAYRKAIGRFGIERGAHNTFLSVLVEQGIVGLLLFLSMLGLILRMMLRLPKSERLFQIALLTILLLGLLTINWEIRKQFWLVLSLMLMTAYARSPRSEIT